MAHPPSFAPPPPLRLRLRLRLHRSSLSHPLPRLPSICCTTLVSLQAMLPPRSLRAHTPWSWTAASIALIILLQLLDITTAVPVLPPLYREGDSLSPSPPEPTEAPHRRALAVPGDLQRRAPQVVSPLLGQLVPGEETPKDGAGGVTPTDPPAPTKSDPPEPSPPTKDPVPTPTRDVPPPTKDPVPVPTTTTTTTTTTSSKQEETTTTTSSSSKVREPSRAPNSRGGQPTAPPGPLNPTGSGSASSTKISPTGAPTSEKSDGPPVLPIVLGTVLGLGAVIGAGVFFFLRFRKDRRFDSKRPLSFLALSLDDPSGAESASSRAMGATDSLYDTNRPITSQPSLRYTPPVMSGVMGNDSRYSYQSSSDQSGATAAQYAQWSQDDENAALVGGPSRQQQIMMAEHGEDSGRLYGGGPYSQEHDMVPRSDSQQSFIASSMLPLAPHDPLHARYSRQQQQQQQLADSPTLTRQDVPLRALNVDAGEQQGEEPGSPGRPLSIHSNAASMLSVRNPSEHDRQLSVRSAHSAAGSVRSEGQPKVSEELQYL
ncbi:unnamed protein product [Mortierella alpina]